MYTYTIILVLLAVFSVSSVLAEDCEEGEKLYHGKCFKFGRNPGDSCANSILECKYIPNTSCSNKKCECRFGYELHNQTCLPGLNRECNSSNPDQSCKPTYSECATDNKCACKSGYVQHMRECVKIAEMREACSSDFQCKHLPNSHCLDGSCLCRPGFDLRGEKCTVGLYGPCMANENCKGNNLECKNNYCKCVTNFFPNNRECVQFTTNLGDSCSHWRACDTIGHAICFNNKCQCKWNYFKNSLGNCVGGLHAICTHNECHPPNYTCLNKKCVCADNYEESVGQCVAKNAGK